MQSKFVILKDGVHHGTFDTRMAANMYISTVPDLSEAHVVPMEDPWPAQTPANQKTERASGVSLFLLDADGHVKATTDTGYIMIMSNEESDHKTGILVPVREGGAISLKSLKDDELLTKVSEAFAMLVLESDRLF